MHQMRLHYFKQHSIKMHSCKPSILWQHLNANRRYVFLYTCAHVFGRIYSHYVVGRRLHCMQQGLFKSVVFTLQRGQNVYFFRAKKVMTYRWPFSIINAIKLFARVAANRVNDFSKNLECERMTSCLNYPQNHNETY